MRTLLLTLLLCPLLVAAQSSGPKFKNDTLYTKGQYKIYKGRVLEFGKGSDKTGRFKYVTIKNGIDERKLIGNTIVVTAISNFRYSEKDDAYINISGIIAFKDSTKATVDLVIAFDNAIEDAASSQPELIVPAEYRSNASTVMYNELKRLLNLYIEAKIDQATYEAEKKKLLSH